MPEMIGVKPERSSVMQECPSCRDVEIKIKGMGKRKEHNVFIEEAGCGLRKPEEAYRLLYDR